MTYERSPIGWPLEGQLEPLAELATTWATSVPVPCEPERVCQREQDQVHQGDGELAVEEETRVEAPLLLEESLDDRRAEQLSLLLVGGALGLQ